jgi:2-polyprenyl-3-methyl-5-hydroxy-6-metoxy-1,4-benzoquinol methylase
MNEDQQKLNAEGREIWDQKAEFWDSLHGDSGNRFHRTLVIPSVEKLLALQAGERVLDVACGNGIVSRRLAELGAKVTGADFSPKLIKRAQQRGQSAGEPIDYRVVDAVDENALIALGEGKFDAIVCTMALMDMPVIDPLFRAARRLLTPDGRFVFATAHPAFNSSNPIFVADLEDRDGEEVITHSLKIKAYLDIPPVKAVGATNEPAPHYYYHRPLHELLGSAFAAGFVLDGVEEPGFDRESSDPMRLTFWTNVWQMPPVLAGRLRPKG